MNKINSAYEKALERFQQKKAVPQSEIDRLEYTPVGSAIAASFLQEQDFNIIAEIKRHPEEFKKYIIQGIQETFLKNIRPPADRSLLEKNHKAMEGIYQIKMNKQAADQILNDLDYLLKYYEQAAKKAYSQFRENFAARINAKAKAMDKSAAGRMNIDPEKQPGFREEWMMVRSRLNAQYDEMLNEKKEKLRLIS